MPKRSNPSPSDDDYTLPSSPSHSLPSDSADSNLSNRPEPPKKPKQTPKPKPRKENPLIWEVMEEEHSRWISENINSGSEIDFPNQAVETVDPSPDVLLPLLRFQKEWLAWALNQEASSFKGGILADEMGMGKTIQAISLVLTARSLRPCSPEIPSSSMLPSVNCTLVVCPVVAVIQWVGEIQRHTREGSARVLVYHGPKRSSAGAIDFSSYDFVLTTYSVVEGEFRRFKAPPKVKCKYCGKLYYPDKMKFHLKYYCGPHAVRTDKQAKQARKKDESKGYGKKGKEAKKVGKGKEKDDHVERAVGAESVLHTVKWERIILDEAHSIKARHCSTSRAIFSLESTYRWALSGTPLQNRVGELYSLVRFLQVHPYAFYFCRDCDCKASEFQSVSCASCEHSSVRHFLWWNRYVARPIQKPNEPEDANRALFFLRARILKSIVLRRTKKGRASDLALPPRIISLRRDKLDKNEEDFYEALYNQSQIQFGSYVSAGTLMNNYGHIFELLIRLRQAVDHPYLVIYSKTSAAINNSYAAVVETSCGICHDPVEGSDRVVTSCDHVFCRGCLVEYSAASGVVSCPSCSKPLTVDLTTDSSAENCANITTHWAFKKSSILSRVNLDEFKTSSKIDALKEEIRNMVERDGSAKGIVFSQFTSFLDLISYSLQKAGVKCVQLVGSMTLAERERAITKFSDDGDVKIFLMSLKAGGVALNLTVASHVFLMDPWWNPAVEYQAQDRIHRIGQYKPIRVVRFVIKDTIEERVLKLQEKKELVFEGTLGGSSEALAKLTEADLKFLFCT